MAVHGGVEVDHRVLCHDTSERLAILGRVTTPRETHPFRRPLLVLLTAVPLSLAAGVFSSAAADAPTRWARQPHVSVLDFLLVLFLIPLGVAALISLLVYVGTLRSSRDEREPAEHWRSGSEWFGGPTKGLERADEVGTQELADSSGRTGGTSAQW